MNTKRNKQIGLGTMLLSMAIFGMFIFTGEKKNSIPPTQTYSNIAHGLEIGTKVEFTFLSKNHTTSEQKIATSNQDLGFKQNKQTEQYELTYKIIEKEKPPKNILFQINQASGQARIQVSGFEKANRLSLLLNNKNIHTHVPVDWTGRIELKTKIKKGNLCLKFSSSTSFCHYIGAGGVA